MKIHHSSVEFHGRKPVRNWEILQVRTPSSCWPIQSRPSSLRSFNPQLHFNNQRRCVRAPIGCRSNTSAEIPFELKELNVFLRIDLYHIID
jgi:hypothetical protein